MSSALELIVALGEECPFTPLPTWGTAGTWIAWQGPQELHLLRQLGGLEPIWDLTNIFSSFPTCNTIKDGTLLLKVKTDKRKHDQDNRDYLWLESYLGSNFKQPRNCNACTYQDRVGKFNKYDWKCLEIFSGAIIPFTKHSTSVELMRSNEMRRDRFMRLPTELQL